MTIDIKHKHASHVIIIEGQAFKANDKGQWDLTDIWRTLELPKGKQPGKWVDTKKAKTLEQTGNIGSLNKGRAGSVTQATKRATLAYAGWVSDEFEAMVYDAFEAILEMPEVALLVADKMRSMGNDHSAAILERHVFNDRCDWNALKGFKKAPKRPLSPAQREQQKYLRQAKAHEKANPIR
ncbi:hypothetical protein AO069_10055 [Pseudomonas syringae pv. syringae PD2774]|uniref:hypothetical protein n=1 Tax=Pseudomonas syringae TaxID=317 RepID=UPI000737619E|nr:hypothetical protein [Pseudomonas syringae]KTB79265.1 hypothetical protein AO069_10055 [Pseudomonas syringae pv. syringae PD2774]